jgi:hypothetical protein
VDPAIHRDILGAAAKEGVSVSAWITSAARDALRRRAGLAAVEVWERERGRFTEAEMEEARRIVKAQLRKPAEVRRSA